MAVAGVFPPLQGTAGEGRERISILQRVRLLLLLLFLVFLDVVLVIVLVGVVVVVVVAQVVVVAIRQSQSSSRCVGFVINTLTQPCCERSAKYPPLKQFYGNEQSG